ncbi:response regulator [Acidithiobacillus sulfuriphilus]|nr:response regulator [Acidithiobacillus sulfuriphilus]
MNEHLLLVDHHPSHRKHLVEYLRNRGFLVRVAEVRGVDRALAMEIPELLIFDGTISSIVSDDAFLLRDLRACDHTFPIVFLNAAQAGSGCADALDAGADDCIMHPFSLLALLARLRATLRRSTMHDPAPSALHVGPYRLDADSRELIGDERAISLSEPEFSLLYFLFQLPGPVPAALLMALLNKNFYNYQRHSLAELMIHLQQLLGDQPGQPRYLNPVGKDACCLEASKFMGQVA